jgi:hypothetical protein
MITDPKGDEQYYKYQRDLEIAVRNAREKGDNPFELFDPRSPKYFAAPEVLNRYGRTMQEVITDKAEAIRRNTKKPEAAVPARKDGETPAQYLERINSGK